MCYSSNLKHKEIKIIISNCFGVGFDWNDPELKKAVENRDDAIWEIMDWIVKGGAEECDDAYSFEEYLDEHYGLKHLYREMREYEVSKLIELSENAYLSNKYKEYIKNFFDGSWREDVKEYEKNLQKTKKINAKSYEEGIVYLLKSNQYYKIGKARNLPSRLNTLAVGVKVPYDIKLIHSFKSNNYSKAEKALHKKFADKNSTGEWFELEKKDIEYIKSIGDYQL